MIRSAELGALLDRWGDVRGAETKPSPVDEHVGIPSAKVPSCGAGRVRPAKGPETDGPELFGTIAVYLRSPK